MPVTPDIRRSRVLTSMAAGVVAIWSIAMSSTTLLSTTMWPVAAAADAGPSAQALVKETTTRLIEVLESERESLRDDPQRLHEVVEEFILPYFDFERMSRRVLGKKQWNKAGPEQRARFVSAFRSLLVRTYATVLNQYGDQTITWPDPVPRKKDDEIVVPMLIGQSGSRTIRAAYAMHRDGQDWKAFDVSIDGVSLVTNYRSSFRAEIAQHGIDGLITRLDEMNAESSR